jgi:holo-[acyl-carrier protein] synthase
MIKGVGVDIIDVQRFRNLDEKERFLTEVFAPSEIRRAPAQVADDFYFAALFAVKEAFLKGLGVGLSAGFRWRDIELTADRRLLVSGTLGQHLQQTGVGRVHVTVSSTDDHAVAVVVLQTTMGENVP